eukprot:441289-Pyramimonas_sp.AAC.1
MHRHSHVDDAVLRLQPGERRQVARQPGDGHRRVCGALDPTERVDVLQQHRRQLVLHTDAQPAEEKFTPGGAEVTSPLV